MTRSPASDLRRPSSDAAFSAAVKAVQALRGSRSAYARMEEAGGFRTAIDEELRDFIESMESVFLATASAEGQPYVQHRGGPPGFLKVLDERTIAFADFVDRNNAWMIETRGSFSFAAKAFQLRATRPLTHANDF